MKTRADLEKSLSKLSEKKIDGKLSWEEIDEMYHIQDLLNERHDDGHDDDYYEGEDDDDYDEEDDE